MTTTPVRKLDSSWANETVSAGTMREADLIPTFIGVLDDVDPERAEEMWSAFDAISDNDGEVLDDKDEEASELCHHLFDVLDEIAPEGTSFGSHEGDGACYGFWGYEDEGEDDDDEVDSNPFAGPGGLLDEVRQAERLIGTD